MTYAATLTTLTGAADDAVALSAAARFAKATHGIASCFLALPANLLVDWGAGLVGGAYLTPELIETIEKDNIDIRTRTEANIRELTQQEGLELADDEGRMVLLSEQTPFEINLDGEVPLCDLLIASPTTLGSLGVWGGVISAGLIQGRLPLLVARRQPSDGVIAIAWDGSAAAGRAVKAALPLLKSASKVVVLQDPEHLADKNRATASPERLKTYLHLHGVEVAEVVRQNQASRKGRMATLCRELDVETLVAGAYTHARLFEELVGGCTEDLLQRTQNFNMFLAH